MTSFFVIIGIALGITGAAVGFFSAIFSWGNLLVLYLLILSTSFFFCSRREFCIFCLSLFLGIFILLFRLFFFPLSSPLDFPESAFLSSNRITGVIDAMPDFRPTSTEYQLRVLSFQLSDGSSFPFDEPRIFLVTDRAPFPRFLPGDRLVVTAKIARPREDADFRYDLFLRTRGIDATIPFASLQMIGRDSTLWFSLLRSIALFRQVLIDHAHSILPFPHASLLMGLTIGADGTIPQSALTDFRTAGLTHILAVSGSNVTMLLTLLCTLLFFLPLRWRVGPLLFGVVAFTFLVGADAPVVRASIMGIIGLFALLSERKTIPVFTLLLTLSVMVLWNPLSLLYDPGFQLSFLATLGITLFSPRLLRFFSFLPSCFALRESFATTVAAFLFTLPVSVLVFHQLSLVAPLANVLAAPLIAPAMLFGLCAVLLSFLSLSLGVLSASVGWVFLDLLMQIAHYCALVPFALFSFQT